MEKCLCVCSIVLLKSSQPQCIYTYPPPCFSAPTAWPTDEEKEKARREKYRLARLVVKAETQVEETRRTAHSLEASLTETQSTLSTTKTVRDHLESLLKKENDVRQFTEEKLQELIQSTDKQIRKAAGQIEALQAQASASENQVMVLQKEKAAREMEIKTQAETLAVKESVIEAAQVEKASMVNKLKVSNAEGARVKELAKMVGRRAYVYRCLACRYGSSRWHRTHDRIGVKNYTPTAADGGRGGERFQRAIARLDIYIYIYMCVCVFACCKHRTGARGGDDRANRTSAC